MSIARALPYLLLALVLGAAGYLAGAVTDPFAPTVTNVRGELAAQEPRLRRELEQARGEAAELTGELQRAQGTIDRLRADLADTRTRIAELQQRAEAAEQARADAVARIAELAGRVAALETRANERAPAQADRADSAGAPSAETVAPASPSSAQTATADADAPNDADTAQTQASPNGAATEETGAAADGAANEAAETDPSPAQETGQETAEATEQPSTGQTPAAPDDEADTRTQPDDRAADPDPSVADAGPPGFEQDPRPGPQALATINPTTRQANRLVAGVQAYQEADYQEAFLAWLPLAQAGYARAQLHLGALFLEGRGTDRNDPLAYAWLTIARDNGSQNAGPLLDQLRDRMSTADLDTARQFLTRARQTAGNTG